MPKQEETETANDSSVLKVYKEDKEFFVRNKTLEEYLCFKHKKLIRTQEDLMNLIKIELEEVITMKKK